MKFPNASKGISKIFLAEILSLVALVAMTVTYVLGVALSETPDDIYNSGAGALGVAVLTCLSVAGIVSIVSLVLKIVGVVQAAKDEGSFQLIIYVAVADIIASMVASAFSASRLANSIANVVSDVVQLLVTVLIILGVCNLALQLKNGDMLDKGHRLIKLIFMIQLFSIVASICMIFIWSFAFKMILIGLACVSAVLSIASYVLYLMFLGDAKKMLQK